jgi:hypothetical protein
MPFTQKLVNLDDPLTVSCLTDGEIKLTYYHIKHCIVWYVSNWHGYLKVHKRDNFLGSDYEFCTFLYLVMLKY